MPSHLTEWAATIARRSPPSTTTAILAEPAPRAEYRSCLGLLRLSRRVGPERLEAAARALLVGDRSYSHVDAILKHGLDRVPLEPTVIADTFPFSSWFAAPSLRPHPTTYPLRYRHSCHRLFQRLFELALLRVVFTSSIEWRFHHLQLFD